MGSINFKVLLSVLVTISFSLIHFFWAGGFKAEALLEWVNTMEPTQWLICSTIIFLQTIVLYNFGQPIVSKSGHLKLWEGYISGKSGSKNSRQHVMDWYTFTHVTLGFIYYGVLSLIFPDMGINKRFQLALLIEVFWEIFENSPSTIARYCKRTGNNKYSGDSILNSVADVFAMSFGFLLTHKLSGMTIVALGVKVELILLGVIKDNLMLKFWQYFFPSKAVAKWQAGTGKTKTTDITKVDAENVTSADAKIKTPDGTSPDAKITMPDVTSVDAKIKTIDVTSPNPEIKTTDVTSAGAGIKTADITRENPKTK